MSVAPPRRKSARLQQRYRDLRDSGASAMVRREAYNDWFRQCCAEGHSPSALRTHSPDEVERYWAHTVPGPDGHLYWTGPKRFLTNDKRDKIPQRWAWEKTGYPLDPYTEIEVTCGAPSCVNTLHMRVRSRGERRIRLTDDRAFGALQVLAMRLGHTPAKTEWDAAQLPVTAGAMERRFGSWRSFCEGAGLEWQRPNKSTVAICVEAVRALATELGHQPSRTEWKRHAEWLRERGYPSSPTTLKTRLGGGFAAVVSRVLKDAA